MRDLIAKVMFIITAFIPTSLFALFVGFMWMFALSQSILLTVLLSPFLGYATLMVYVIAKDQIGFIKAHVLS